MIGFHTGFHTGFDRALKSAGFFVVIEVCLVRTFDLLHAFGHD